MSARYPRRATPACRKAWPATWGISGREAAAMGSRSDAGFRRGTLGKNRPEFSGSGGGFGPPEHGGDSEILPHEKVKAAPEFGGQFVGKVLALIGDFTGPCRDRLPPADTILRTTLGA